MIVCNRYLEKSYTFGRLDRKVLRFSFYYKKKSDVALSQTIKKMNILKNINLSLTRYTSNIHWNNSAIVYDISGVVVRSQCDRTAVILRSQALCYKFSSKSQKQESTEKNIRRQWNGHEIRCVRWWRAQSKWFVFQLVHHIPRPYFHVDYNYIWCDKNYKDSNSRRSALIAASSQQTTAALLNRRCS